MAALVFLNVVTRYLFNNSIIWVEELTQYEMIWVAYLGAGLALREGRHVAVDTLRYLRTLLALAMALFLALLVVWRADASPSPGTRKRRCWACPPACLSGRAHRRSGMLLHLLLFWRRFVARLDALHDIGSTDQTEGVH